MRFWKWFAEGSRSQIRVDLQNQFKNGGPETLPYHKGEVIVKAPDISEPVASLIKSIEDVEWEFDAESCILKSLKFNRELQLRYIFIGRSGPRCFAEWMTWGERNAVNDAIESFLHKTKEIELAKERESFMCFVKGESNVQTT